MTWDRHRDKLGLSLPSQAALLLSTRPDQPSTPLSHFGPRMQLHANSSVCGMPFTVSHPIEVAHRYVVRPFILPACTKRPPRWMEQSTGSLAKFLFDARRSS